MGRQISSILEQHSYDVPELGRRVIELRPKLDGQEAAFREFCHLVAGLLKIAGDVGRHGAFEDARSEVQRIGGPPANKAKVALKFVCSVVVDMVAQGWDLYLSGRTIELRSPRRVGITPQEVKERIREGHLLERDAQ